MQNNAATFVRVLISDLVATEVRDVKIKAKFFKKKDPGILDEF